MQPFIIKKNLLFFLIIFISLASIIVLQNHTNGFATGHHGFTSSRGALLSKSIVVDKKHLIPLYHKQMLNNGEIIYHTYNRFPFFPFLITGVVMQIFEPNLSMQIYMARQVMNIFVIIALLLCFKIVDEIIRDKYLSLSVALLAFSSYYMLYYNDMIFNDAQVLFGFVLALFLVVKSQKYNIRNSLLILLSCVSISTGWQPYAVFISWFMIDTINQIRTGQKAGEIYKSIIRGPAFIAFISSIIFGVLILGGNILNEWSVTGGSFYENSTIQRMRVRLGVEADEGFKWYKFGLIQAYYIFNMLVPFSGLLTGLLTFKKTMIGWISFILGTLSVLIGGGLFIHRLLRFKQKINFTLLFIFILSGFVWAVPMRHFTAYHDFQARFYIGVSIMFFIILSQYINPAFSKRIAIVTCLLFILSVYQMNAIKSVDAPRLNAITADFQKIYAKLPKNSKVYVDGGGQWKSRDKYGMDFGRNELCADLNIGGQSIDFYLVGHYRVFLENAEYVISKNPDYNRERLTNNQMINLFKNVVIP